MAGRLTEYIMKRQSNSGKITIGVSSCLLGIKSRYSGTHKRDSYIADTLGEYVRFIPICPELEAGMGVPREAVRLEGSSDKPRLIGIESGTDWTDTMNNLAEWRTEQFRKFNLSGFILKNNSPSCGPERVPVFPKKGRVKRNGRGLFANALLKRHPLLPVADEAMFKDSEFRDNFVERVFAYSRLQKFLSGRFNYNRARNFHDSHRLFIRAHSIKHLHILDKMTLQIMKYNPARFCDNYGRLFMEGIKIRSTVSKNYAVLDGAATLLKKDLAPREWNYISEIIKDYRYGLVPLAVPLTEIGQLVRSLNLPDLSGRVYLFPHPAETALKRSNW